MPGTSHKRVTINDIAKMAGTSKTTVSFYLNGKTERMSETTRERVREAIEKTGYEPSPLARGMNAKHSHLLGVIIGDITNSFANQVVKGVAAAASKRDYSLLVSSSNFNREEEISSIERLLAVGVDGFIVQPTAQSMEVVRSIERAGRKLVFLDSNLYDSQSFWVKTDNYEASWRAVSKCVERGYERFLIVAATPGLITSRIERYGGFAEALQSHDMTFEQLQFSGDAVNRDEVASFLRRNIDGETPTLVFVPNCWALPDVYTVMREYFPLMPGKVGLLGFDNTEWAQLASPSVSCVVQPAHREGEAACNMLIDLVEGNEVAEPHQIINCDIVWGSSTL